MAVLCIYYDVFAEGAGVEWNGVCGSGVSTCIPFSFLCCYLVLSVVLTHSLCSLAFWTSYAPLWPCPGRSPWCCGPSRPRPRCSCNYFPGRTWQPCRNPPCGAGHIYCQRAWSLCPPDMFIVSSSANSESLKMFLRDWDRIRGMLQLFLWRITKRYFWISPGRVCPRYVALQSCRCLAARTNGTGSRLACCEPGSHRKCRWRTCS